MNKWHFLTLNKFLLAKKFWIRYVRIRPDATDFHTKESHPWGFSFRVLLPLTHETKKEGPFRNCPKFGFARIHVRPTITLQNVFLPWKNVTQECKQSLGEGGKEGAKAPKQKKVQNNMKPNQTDSKLWVKQKLLKNQWVQLEGTKDHSSKHLTQNNISFFYSDFFSKTGAYSSPPLHILYFYKGEGIYWILIGTLQRMNLKRTCEGQVLFETLGMCKKFIICILKAHLNKLLNELTCITCQWKTIFNSIFLVGGGVDTRNKPWQKWCFQVFSLSGTYQIQLYISILKLNWNMFWGKEFERRYA